MPPVDERPQVPVRSRAALRAWLHEHHDRHPGAWLVLYKGSPQIKVGNAARRNGRA